MKFPNLNIVWTAGKNPSLRDTPSPNTPSELPTRKTTVEIPQNTNLFLAKDKKSARLKCDDTGKIDYDTNQINTLDYFPLECQNIHYEVDVLI